MDARVLAKLALRVFAIYIIAQGILILPGLLDIAVQAKPSDPILSYPLFLVLATVAPFVTGALLWSLAPRVATWILREAEASIPASPVTSEALQIIAFVTLGAVLLVNTLPRIVGILFAAITTKDLGYVILRGEDFFTAVGVAVLGLALSLGGAFFTRLVRRLRESGTDMGSSNP